MYIVGVDRSDRRDATIFVCQSIEDVKMKYDEWYQNIYEADCDGDDDNYDCCCEYCKPFDSQVDIDEFIFNGSTFDYCRLTLDNLERNRCYILYSSKIY